MQADVASALLEAANLLLVGMGVVFLFLTMLIGAVNLIAWANRLFPEDQSSHSSSQSFTPKVSQNSQQVSPKIVAAITTAVRQYRRNH
ncbi:OadG family protein [Paraglaciecola aquimarina]|uniref:Probable oxaloacetate decarboxylase gamma chain n=1 Tax=Paraglaciecola algarum TaxID=3050085 RepID=A0ABS9DEI4_9ALTE|nr:OadG family transporter subunit [Paraglaciecola sp. G1-23]MCF2950184.1 OadG family protein [Paraglaciecola sp. G1-23]